MRRRLLGWAVLHAAILFGGVIAECADPTGPQPEKVVVEIRVVEVATEKLRNLGFDWSRIGPSGAVVTTSAEKTDDIIGETFRVKSQNNSEQFFGFLKALEQNSLARTLAEPTLATLSGRPASLAIADSLKVDVVPIVLGNGRIRLEYRIEVSSREPKGIAARRRDVPTSTPLRLDAALDLESGKTTLVHHTRFHAENADGKLRESELLVFARVELLKRDSLPLSSRVPSGTFEEVPRAFSR